MLVTTQQGDALGIVAEPVRELAEYREHTELKPILRLATQEDLECYEENREKERAAFGIARRKIEEHGLDMHLVDVECSFDRSKLLFYFTAEGRIDFRSLVRDLAQEFRMRIELRQIGVRDEARMVGGIGVCGRPLCCATWMTDFIPVSIKMAKEQNLSMNPGKISGCCGRLLCCLKYEQETYETLKKSLPKQGAIVHTARGRAKVETLRILQGSCTCRLLDEPDEAFELTAEEWAELRGNARDAERERERSGRTREKGRKDRHENGADVPGVPDPREARAAEHGCCRAGTASDSESACGCGGGCGCGCSGVEETCTPPTLRGAELDERFGASE